MDRIWSRECAPGGALLRTKSGPNHLRDPTLRFPRVGRAGPASARQPRTAPRAPTLERGGWGRNFRTKSCPKGYPHDQDLVQELRPHPPFSNAGAWGAGGGSRAESAAAWPARGNLRVGSRRGFGPDLVRTKSGRGGQKHAFQCDALKAPRAPVVRVQGHSNCGFLRPASWVPARPARGRAKRISGARPPHKAYSFL